MHKIIQGGERGFKRFLTTFYISWVKFTLYQLHCCYFDSEQAMFARQRKKLAEGGCTLQLHSSSMLICS